MGDGARREGGWPQPSVGDVCAAQENEVASVQSHFWGLVRKSGFRHKVSLRPRARGSRGPWGQARVLPASLEQLLSHLRGRRLRQVDWPDSSPPHQCAPSPPPFLSGHRPPPSPPACPSRAGLLALQGVRLGLASCPGGRWCCWPRARVLVWHLQAPPPLCPEPVLAVGDNASLRGRGTPARCQEGPRP